MRYVIACFLFYTIELLGVQPPIEEKTVVFSDGKRTYQTPWFTGPLLTPSARTIPQGHFNFQPYLFANNANHHHGILFLFLTQFGLTPWMDFTINPQFFYSWNKKNDSWHFGDLLLGTSFQLLKENFREWTPNIRFAINETFPTGKFQHLNPNKVETDAAGGGSFGTTFSLDTSKLWHCYNNHFLATRIAVQWLVFTPTSIHGPSSYGGDLTTKGTVHPGSSQITFIGLEYSFTQRFVYAMDIVSTYNLKTTFRGETHVPVGRKSNYALSIAPALEYNYTKNIGIIAGIWFPIYTKKVHFFTNGVVAVNIYI